MPGRLVLVDNALIRQAIDDRDGSIVGLGCSSVIAAFYGNVDLLDIGPYHGSERCIVAPACLTLSGSLTGLPRISQLELLSCVLSKLVRN